MGLFSGLFGSDDQTTKVEPWSGAVPYLQSGLAENQNLYNTMGPIAPYTGPQQALYPSQMTGSLQGTIDATQANIPGTMDLIYGALGSPLSGDWMDPQVTQYMSSLMTQGQPTGTSTMIGGQPMTSYNNSPGVSGAPVDWSRAYKTAPQMTAAEIEKSGIDFSTALNNLLYGDPGSNPWITGMANNLANITGQQFGDISRGIQDQLQQTISGIRDVSNQSGALGGSRQALLSGEAMGRTNDALMREYGDMNTNLQGTLANLYGGIFESDLNRKASLASQLFGSDAAERTRQAELQQDASRANMEAIIADRAAQTAATSGNAAAGAANWMAEQQMKLDQQRLGLQAAQQQYTMGLGGQTLGMDAANQLAGYSMLPLQMQNAAMLSYNPMLSQEQTGYGLAQQQYLDTYNAPYDALTRYLGPSLQAAGMGSSSTAPNSGSSLAGALGGAMGGQTLAQMLAGGSGLALGPVGWGLTGLGALIGLG